MKTKLNLLPQLICEQVNGKVRYYTTADGNSYPSVTTILKKYQPIGKKIALDKWRKRIGESSANQVLKSATDAGTFLHQCVENHFNGIDNDSTHDHYYLFQQLLPFLDTIDDVNLLESKLYSDQFKIAGTVDMMALIGDSLFVVDIKNSGRLRNDAYNESYYAQLGLYALMIRERYNITVKKGLIAVSIRKDSDDWNKLENNVQLFEKPMSDCLEKSFFYLRQYVDDIKNNRV